MARLAIAFNSLRMKPDPALAASQQQVIESAQSRRGASRTAQYLRGKGLGDVADLLETGAIDAKTALSYAKEGDSYSSVSGAQLNQMYPGSTYDDKKMYSVNTATGKIAGIGGGDTVIDISNKAESTYLSTLSGNKAERVSAMISGVDVAKNQIKKLNQTFQVLDEGKATTGFASNLRTDINRAISLVFGGDTEAAAKADDTQVLNALLGSDVFPMIKALGIGARGLDTPAEREFLREVMTGTTSMEENALKELTYLRKKYALRALTEWNEKLDSGYFGKAVDEDPMTFQHIDISELNQYTSPYELMREKQDAMLSPSKGKVGSADDPLGIL